MPKFRTSPSKNPFVKHLTALERLRYNRTILQRPQPDACQDSLLLDVPPELRNRIYELVLVQQDMIEIGTDVVARRYAEGERSYAVIKEPPLLRTCQSVRKEASQLYYSSNTFHTEHQLKLFCWLAGLKAETRAMLKDVRATCKTMPVPDEATILPSLLMDIEWFEQIFTRHDCTLGPNVLHVYGGTCGTGNAMSRSQIGSLMNAEQWTVYWIDRNMNMKEWGGYDE